jgi:acyl-CoA thioesterase FadM
MNDITQVIKYTDNGHQDFFTSILQDEQNKMEPNIILLLFYIQNTKPQYNRSLRYDKTIFILVSPVLPNVRKQVSLICLLSIWNISEPKHEICFILVIL